MNEQISILFNSYKIKYDKLNEIFINYPKNKKYCYFYIDFDFILEKFLDIIDYENLYGELISEFVNDFLTEFFNLISHYKNYFYKHLDTVSFFYISINVNKYKKDNNIRSLIELFIKLINMIPRINIFYGENEEQIFFLKYHLFKIISITRMGQDNTLIFMDLGNNYHSELMYKLNKNYYVFKTDNYKKYLYTFEMFRNEFIPCIEDIYINCMLSVMSIFITVRDTPSVFKKNKNIDEIIRNYIINNLKMDFNSETTKRQILSTFKNKVNYLMPKLIQLENNLNSIIYSNMIKTIMENWKHIIKDRNIYRINEILNVPQDKRINIELLMNY